ncbi:hypothetical protein ACT7CZ_09375 [Bacillus cereus]
MQREKPERGKKLFRRFRTSCYLVQSRLIFFIDKCTMKREGAEGGKVGVAEI